MTICVIQFFGAGDIIWEQTLVRRIANGSPILWPIEPHYVEGFSRAYPDITFVDRTKIDVDYMRKDDYKQNGMRFLPLRWADQILKVPYKFCMSSKYDLYNMDYRCWKEKAMWHRDVEKENELFDLLGCSTGNYALVNKYFGTHSQLQANIVPPPDLRVVEMSTIEGFSIFDYAKVIKNASAIHVVSSSILFILEMLDIKAPEVHLYCRKPIEKDFSTVDYIFEKHKYELHY